MKGSGAFKTQKSGDTVSYGHDNGSGGGFNFAASRSSSIYGSSTTVTPKSLTTFILVRY